MMYEHETVGFDIETTGLHVDRGHYVTVVCLWEKPLPDSDDEDEPGPLPGKKVRAAGGCVGTVYNFLEAAEESAECFTALAEALGAHLDAARRLTAFNGIHFDIPFLAGYFGYGADRIAGWTAKTFDVLRLYEDAYGTRFGFAALLAANGLQGKSGSGKEAIEWAKHRAMWPKLEDYCLDDARLSFDVGVLERIQIPLHPSRLKRLSGPPRDLVLLQHGRVHGMFEESEPPLPPPLPPAKRKQLKVVEE